MPRLPSIAAALLAPALLIGPALAGPVPFLSGWRVTGDATTRHEIRGTGDRNNPLRRVLDEPFTGEELFVRFRIRYDAASIDLPGKGDGEFFVLWLDESEGSDVATHSHGIPNVGLHVNGGGANANHFMARFEPQAESFGPALEGDRDYLVVARVWKPAPDAAFENLDFWIDPEATADAEHAPLASAPGQGKLRQVRWLGFSTGRKTEPGDRIEVWDVAAASDWRTILDLPPEPPEAKPDPELVDPPEVARVDPPPDKVTTDHWSFQPLRRPTVPEVANKKWLRTPVDAFVARRHEQLGITPSPQADRATLRRRLALDLTGLPPDETGGGQALDLDAYADQLLLSLAYGERWGRHWLDVARWAESNGHQHNRHRPYAWRYRDYVVESFASNKPFDLFLREQIAGDELAPFKPEHLVATGFLAAARYSGNEMDKQIQRNDILVDIVNTTSKAFLGVTLECAQCHDHFFDPLTAWDYYNLQAFFARGQPGNVVLSNRESEQANALIGERWGLFESVRTRLIDNKRKQGYPEPVLVIPKSVVSGMTKAERAEFDALEARIAKLPQAWSYYSPVTTAQPLAVAPHEMRWPLQRDEEVLQKRKTRYLVRGDVKSPGPEARPAWPQVFGETPDTATGGERPRSALAEWLTSPENPLTARVWVNRLWHWHFGRGLVETTGDFGTKGAKPTHPELLDWLASELMQSGWDTHQIHRLIVRSATYRQASAHDPARAKRDPANESWWHWQPRRLEAEAIRDQLLAAAGRLDRAAGGPSVPLAEAESSARRAIYLEQRRDNLPHEQVLFDGANAVTSCSRRRTSTVALQPLWMLNSEFTNEMAAALAQQIEKGATAPADRARLLLRRVYSREPAPEEVQRLASMLEDGKTPLQEICLALLNTNEFVYIP